MANWVLKGLRTGIKTTVYPRRMDEAPGVSPGRPGGVNLDSSTDAAALLERCPTGALKQQDRAVVIDQGRCVHCFRCHPEAGAPAAPWERGYEWGFRAEEARLAQQSLARAFGRSLHIRFVDAGACGACMSEARQLNNPYYNMHRLGFFMTPTPPPLAILHVLLLVVHRKPPSARLSHPPSTASAS